MKVLYDGFQFSAVDSATQSGKMLCGSNEEAFTDENFALGFTVARQYLAAGGIDPTGDALFEAVKLRGTTLWAYARFTDKPAITAWAAGDEIYLGARFATDNLRCRTPRRGCPSTSRPASRPGGRSSRPRPALTH